MGDSEPLRRLRAEIARAAPTAATVLILGESGTGKELVAREAPSHLEGRGRALRPGQLRRHPGRADRVRALRPREGLVHRRRAQADRKVRRGRRRNDLPRRGRRHVRPRPGQGPSRARGGRGRACRRREGREGERPRHRGHQPRPDRVHPRRAVSRGPLLPPERSPADDASAARAARGRSPSSPGTSRRRLPSAITASPRRFAASALGLLAARAWPGNVRELRNLVERVLIMTDAEPIEARDLPPEVRVAARRDLEPGPGAGDPLGLQGVRRARVSRCAPARERLEHQPHRRGHPDAAVEPVQEDRAPQDLRAMETAE